MLDMPLRCSAASRAVARAAGGEIFCLFDGFPNSVLSLFLTLRWLSWIRACTECNRSQICQPCVSPIHSSALSGAMGLPAFLKQHLVRSQSPPRGLCCALDPALPSHRYQQCNEHWGALCLLPSLLPILGFGSFLSAFGKRRNVSCSFSRQAPAFQMQLIVHLRQCSHLAT